MKRKLKFIPLVVQAKYIRNFELQLVFNNQETRRIDIEPYLVGPIFRPLK